MNTKEKYTKIINRLKTVSANNNLEVLYENEKVIKFTYNVRKLELSLWLSNNCRIIFQKYDFEESDFMEEFNKSVKIYKWVPF